MKRCAKPRPGSGIRKKKISPNTSAYCQARTRLNHKHLDRVNHDLVSNQQSQIAAKHLWYGRDVKVVDGSSISMPDTQANQDVYPQPSGQKQGCGFPVMRIVAMFSLVTGLMLSYRKSHLGVHERILWHQMWDDYRAGDVALGDRGFCSLADYWMLLQRGVDCVMRLHQMRKEKRVIQRFNSNDYLVQWQKSRQAPKWLIQEQWKHVPDSMTVRQVKVNVNIAGFRTRTIILATTLLDNKKYPPRALADLYRRRWMAELFLKDIKITMRMDVVHGKTPEMVHKELTIFIIAYCNLQD